MTEPKFANKELAIACLKAQKVREDSYNNEASRYNLSHLEAASAVCPNPDDAYIVWLLNFSAWNDIQTWAEATHGIKWDSPEVLNGS